MSNLDAKIWAIPEKLLFQKEKWQGFLQKDVSGYLELFRKKGEFLPRGPLENNPEYKQIIGQVVLQVGNKFLLHQITASSSEERLHSLWPIFLGGHIEEIDVVNGKDIVLAAIEREFQEEVVYHGNIISKMPLGIVYLEDENPVNRVHVGLIYHFVGDSENIVSNEEVIGNLRFVEVDELVQMKERLTYWSRLVLPTLKTL